jgi:Trypsin-like peptidase domain
MIENMKRRGTSLVVMGLFLSSLAAAQDAVPSEILNRTLMIKVGNKVGTSFVIDYQGKAYLITARHIAAGLPERNATIQLNRSNTWMDIKTVRTIFPVSNDVDIAVFDINEKVDHPYLIKSADLGGMTMGQEIWFLGYPYGGLRSHFRNGEAPFIKKGTISAIDASKANATILYIDGFNNPGFSGGPILYWDFNKHVYGISGVVMGYREDTAKVLVNGEHIDTQFLVNSGILIGYSIEHAIEAIKQSQSQR